ncbi:MAG: hypothetical protein HY011_09130 [Acidobacteria bacterium]|nr:hypothetical protein [Acidobacteriota bacterium]
MQEKFLRILGYETADAPAKKKELLGLVAKKLKDFNIKVADVRTTTVKGNFKVFILIPQDTPTLDPILNPPWPGFGAFNPQDGVFEFDTTRSVPAAK